MPVRLIDVGYSYAHAKNPALVNVTADLSEPLVAVLGPNGAGKSTLLRILATQVRARTGFIEVDGRRIGGNDLRAYRERLGWMPQQLGMFGGYTCAEFLRYIAWMKRVAAKNLEPAVAEALSTVNLSAESERPIKALFGGMRQRLGLAQAILASPRLLILDEPTVGLDPRERAEFRAHLRHVSTRCQILLSTHLVDDVASLADEVLVLDRGHVAFTGPLSAMCAGRSRPTAVDVEAAYLDLVPAGS